MRVMVSSHGTTSCVVLDSVNWHLYTVPVRILRQEIDQCSVRCVSLNVSPLSRKLVEQVYQLSERRDETYADHV